MAKRYEQMLRLIEQVKPRVIVEVGVHKAIRSIQMSRQALLYNSPVFYIGYDVFGTVDEQFQKDALNGKGSPSEQIARQRLGNVGHHLEWELVVGDTRVTLAGQKVEADFAFIDGDHRVEAIQSDYEALSECPCVVFDDFYAGDLSAVDIDKYGANRLVEELIAQGRRVEFLPVKDKCVHGAHTQLVVVWS